MSYSHNPHKKTARYSTTRILSPPTVVVANSNGYIIPIMLGVLILVVITNR